MALSMTSKEIELLRRALQMLRLAEPHHVEAIDRQLLSAKLDVLLEMAHNRDSALMEFVP
jgi:hypothetical protein